jgi:glycine dehydrogenase
MPNTGDQAIDAVSGAPFGSASILLISWAYIKMLGGQGLTDSSKIALLSANYMANRLSGHYNLRFKNGSGRVAHELLIDLAEFDKCAGLKVTDFAKRLQVRFPRPHRVTLVPITPGLWFPPADLFLAHFYLYVD